MEAVNIKAVLSDTSQLSVIRGSSLLLREAAHNLCDKINNISTKLKPISTGASAGLYHFDASDGDAANILYQAVVSHLDTDYSDFTFVVDIVPDSGGFQKDQTTLINKNRYRQLQQLSIALPLTNTSNNSSQVSCSLDGGRPATEHTFRQQAVSSSVNRRLCYGRKKRKSFFADELNDKSLLELRFTCDLETLAASDAHGRLNNKLAVLYFDGNQFGNIQQRFCSDAISRKRFDDTILTQHQRFLKTLIDDIKEDPDFLTDNGKIRLEVLIWGGDEVLLVVPAWCGLNVLQHFYQTIDGWTFPEKENNAEPMTYSAGLVFSQANTPMYRLSKLAKDLAENVKTVHSKTSLFDYMILESLDFPSEPLSILRERQYAEKAKGRTLLQAIDSQQLDNLGTLVRQDMLPKSQVISLAQIAIHHPDQFDDTLKQLKLLVDEHCDQIDIECILERVFRTPDSNDVAQMLAKYAAGTLSDSVNIWPWVHLAELWDYLLLEKQGD